MNFFKNFYAGNKRLVSNVFSLSSLEIVNHILPLITLPYLVRVLGPEKYGLIAFAQAFVQYFMGLTEYGFNFSATREISIHRQDIKKVSQIFSSVMLAKLLLMALSFFILINLIFFIPRFRPDWLLYIFSFGMVVGNVLFPAWFFQGVERMEFILFLNSLSRFLFTIAIFIFIRAKTDYAYIPLIASLSTIAVSILGLWIARVRFNIRFWLPSLADAIGELKEGRHIFLSRASISLYTTTNTFILGLFTNNTVVGYFSAGEKIVRAIIRLFNPIFQAAYPYIAKLMAESKAIAIKKLRRLLAIVCLMSFVIFIIFTLFSRNAVELILGRNFMPSIIIVRILSPLIFIVPAACILANLVLLPLKLDKYVARICVSGGALNAGLLFLFLYILNLNGEGAALATLITEAVLIIATYIILRKQDIRLC